MASNNTAVATRQDQSVAPSALIPLCGDLGKGLYAIVDVADLHIVSGMRWYLSAQGYAVANVPVPRSRKTVSMHRVLMGAKPRQGTDHANRDKLDNRRANLRFATSTLNNANHPVHRHCQSGFKGVARRNNRWQARIRVNHKTTVLGRFDTPEQAAAAYDVAARAAFGEFASLNFGGVIA